MNSTAAAFKYPLRLDFFYPLEIALGPGINKAEHEDRDKDENLDEREAAITALDPAAERRRDWENEGDLHLEDDKDQRDDVEADVEVHPGAAGRGLAAFVGRELALLRIVRAQKLADEQVDADKPGP